MQNEKRVRDELLTIEVTVQGKTYVENEMEMRGKHWNYGVDESWETLPSERHKGELKDQ